MNLSGPVVATALRGWRRTLPSGAPGAGPGVGRERGILVLLHDDLDAPLGSVKLRSSKLSARGHNGVKSCVASLGGEDFWRVASGEFFWEDGGGEGED